MTHTITCWSEKGSLRVIISTSTTLAYFIMPAHCQMVVCVCGSSWDTHHGTRGATISMLSGGAATCDRHSSCDERVPVRIGMDIECLPEKRRSARVEMWRAASGRMIRHSPRNSAGNTFRHQSARERCPVRRVHSELSYSCSGCSKLAPPLGIGNRAGIRNASNRYGTTE